MLRLARTTRAAVGMAALGAAAALLLLLPPRPAFVWNATGHMVIGAIAEPRLNPVARANVERLLKINASPKSATFITAGVWMDDVRAQGVGYFDRWHYHNRAHSPDGTPFPKEPHADNVAWAINESVTMLGDKYVPNFEKARALRILLHTVQDIHQPLHAGSRYTAVLPEGDRGGNGFRLSRVGKAKNLHAYWDSAIGLFAENLDRPLPPTSEPVVTLARSVVAAYPPEKLPERAELNPEKWLDEGYQLLTTVVYPTSATPDEAYVVRSREIARRRVALAGYRLAALLNTIWPAEGAAVRATSAAQAGKTRR